MRYLLDTNIVLAYLRGGKTFQYLQRKFKLFNDANQSVLSIVSLGELESLVLRNKWGITRLRAMERSLKEFHVLDINHQEIIKRYAEIENYSQGKLVTQPLPKGMSARNMGKNDIWIAATASVAELSLISFDKDFLHLNNFFLNFIYVDVKNI